MPGSIAITPTSIPLNTATVLTLVGSSTAWTGATVFSFQSDNTGSAISGVVVTDNTHATLVVTTQNAAGQFVIWDNGAVRSNTITVQRIDFQSVVYGAIFDLQAKGIANYNADVASGAIVGKAIPANNALDDRPVGLVPGRVVAKIANRAPTDFPQIVLKIAGGSEPITPTMTFGLSTSTANTDAIIPLTFELTQTITYDGVKDSDDTPLEAYIDAAMRAGYPKLGINYCKGYTTTNRREDKRVGDVQRTVRTKRITVTLWPHLAAAS